jgi:CheY-like chemotaxis protein
MLSSYNNNYTENNNKHVLSVMCQAQYKVLFMCSFMSSLQNTEVIKKLRQISQLPMLLITCYIILFSNFKQPKTWHVGVSMCV